MELLNWRASLALLLAMFAVFRETGALPSEVNICGLYVVHGQDNSIQTAFTGAVSAVNANTELLADVNLVANPTSVPEFDSFVTARTGYFKESLAREDKNKNGVCEKMELGIAAVFGPDSVTTSGQVEAVCDTMEVPHIQTHFNANLNRSTCSINLYPHPETFADILLQLVNAYAWKDYTILYEDDDSLVRVRLLLEKYDPRGYTVTVRQLPENDMKPLFREILKNKMKNIVIDCSIDTLEKVLQQMHQIGIMGDEFSVIITNLDFHTLDLEPYRYSGTNTTGMRIVNPASPLVQAAIEQWAADAAVKGETTTPEAGTLRLSSALMWDAVHLFSRGLQSLDESHQVELPGLQCEEEKSWEHGFSLLNFMKTTEMEGLTGPVKFDTQGFRTDFSLDIFELNSEDEGESTQTIGYFKNHNLNLTRVERAKEDFNKELETVRNKTFVVIIALSEPYIMLQASPAHLSGNDRYEGFGIDLIKELALMLGFNYTFLHIPDLGYGGCDLETEICGGMLGEVQKGNADLAITDLTITSERAKGVDFTKPFMNLGIALLHTQPMPLQPSTFSFLDPFSGEVWLYLFAAVVAVSLELYVMARLTPDEWTNPYPCIEEPEELENQFSMLNSFWFTIGALMQQGSEIAPIAPSTRMVAGMWWFFTLIMVSSYTANLAAFLTVTPQHELISEPRQLANQDEIEYGAKQGGATYKFFEASADPTFQKMFKRMSHSADNQVGVKRVLESEGKYAFFMESSSIEYTAQRECDVRQVGLNLDEKGYGIAMRKNAEYLTALSAGVVKLHENGKLSELKTRWWEQRRGGGKCSGKKEESAAEALTVENVGGVFLVLGVGVAVAVILAFGELLWDLACRAHAGEVSFKWELWEELKFIFKCSGSTKPVKKAKTEEERLEDALKEFEQISPYAMGFNGSGESNGKSALNGVSDNHKEPLQ